MPDLSEPTVRPIADVIAWRDRGLIALGATMGLATGLVIGSVVEQKVVPTLGGRVIRPLAVCGVVGSTGGALWVHGLNHRPHDLIRDFPMEIIFVLWVFPLFLQRYNKFTSLGKDHWEVIVEQCHPVEQKGERVICQIRPMGGTKFLGIFNRNTLGWHQLFKTPFWIHGSASVDLDNSSVVYSDWEKVWRFVPDRGFQDLSNFLPGHRHPQILCSEDAVTYSRGNRIVRLPLDERGERLLPDPRGAILPDRVRQIDSGDNWTALRADEGVIILDTDEWKETGIIEGQFSCMCHWNGRGYLAGEQVTAVDRTGRSESFGKGARIVGMNVNKRGIHVLRPGMFELYNHDKILQKRIEFSKTLGTERVMIDLFPGGAMAHIGNGRALLFAC
jgi:hypothetical protein